LEINVLIRAIVECIIAIMELIINNITIKPKFVMVGFVVVIIDNIIVHKLFMLIILIANTK
jgi:hypothetical protein